VIIIIKFLLPIDFWGPCGTSAYI